MVAGFFDEGDEFWEVCELGGGLAFGAHFGFQLDVDGVREAAFEIGVGVWGAEVSGIEVHAEPRAFDVGDEFEEMFCGTDGVVVFDAEEDAF